MGLASICIVLPYNEEREGAKPLFKNRAKIRKDKSRKKGWGQQRRGNRFPLRKHATPNPTLAKVSDFRPVGLRKSQVNRHLTESIQNNKTRAVNLVLRRGASAWLGP